MQDGKIYSDLPKEQGQTANGNLAAQEDDS
jgi:hypothetical protein